MAERIPMMDSVVDSLLADDRLEVVGGIEVCNVQDGAWPNGHAGWAHTLDVYTHPKWPMYDAQALHAFMMSLVAGIKPTQVDPFYKDAGDILHMGKLYFDENVGRLVSSVAVEIDGDSSLVRRGIVSPTWGLTRSVPLGARTWVRVFPDGGHLAEAAEGKNLSEVPVELLGTRGTDAFPVPRLLQSPTITAARERLAA